MVHKLQIVFEGQITIAAVEARSAASFPSGSAGGYERRLADVGADVEALGARFGVFGIGRGRGAGDVFAAFEFGFVARFAFRFDLCFAGFGFGGVFGAVPGFAERGVGGGGAIGVLFRGRTGHCGNVLSKESTFGEVAAGRGNSDNRAPQLTIILRGAVTRAVTGTSLDSGHSALHARMRWHTHAMHPQHRWLRTLWCMLATARIESLLSPSHPASRQSFSYCTRSTLCNTPLCGGRKNNSTRHWSASAKKMCIEALKHLGIDMPRYSYEV